MGTWIGWLMREKGTELFRYKGVLAVKGSNEPFVFQGIHMLFSGSPQTSKPFKPDDERRCKFVFIGKHPNREELVDPSRMSPKDFVIPASLVAWTSEGGA